MDLVLKIREKVVSFHISFQPRPICQNMNRKCVFQNKARRQQLLLKDHVLDKLEDFIQTIMRSLPEDLQQEISAH